MNFFDRLVDSFFAVLLIANYCKAAAVLSSEKFDKTALVGSNVELKCSLTDSHGHNLYWRKLSGRMTDESFDMNGILTLNKLTLEDDGYYECVSTTDQKVDQVYLNVVPISSTLAINSKYKKYLEKNADESAVLYCELTNEPRLNWRKVHGSLPRFKTIYGEPDNRLFLHYLSEADSGDYECYLPNGRSSIVHLRVKRKIHKFISNELDNDYFADNYYFAETTDYIHSTSPIPPFDNRAKKSLKQSVDAELYSRVDLSCTLETDSKDQIQWRKLDGSLSIDAYIYHDQFIIMNANEEDFGTYECSLPDGRTEQIQLNKKGELSPIDTLIELNIKSNFLNVKEGENIENFCSMSSSDLNNYVIEWYNQQGEPVENNERFTVYTEHSDSLTSMLRIYPVQKEDTGRYECRIEGTAYVKGFELQVKEKYLYHPDTTTDYYYRPETERPEYPYYPETTTDYYYRPETERPEYPYYPETTTDYYYRPETERPEYPYYPETTTDYYYRPETERPEYPYYPETTTDYYYRPETERPEYPYYPETTTDYYYRPETERPEYPYYPETTTDYYYRPETERPEYPYYPETTTDYYYRPETERPEYPYYPETTTDYYYRPETERPFNHYCNFDEATCQNGQCVPRSALCDGKRDCADGTDELCNTPLNGEFCQPNEKQCRNGGCIQKIWLCDGENDCKDGSDEDYCPAFNHGEMCKSTEFKCNNGYQCISKGFMCDKTTDCTDNSDEIGCVKPSITLNPIRFITVRVGESFQIECHAAGFPIPFVNWRLNWGHVCEETRCNITNNQGIGILIVTDVRLSDAGAYSCEAINANGREFAVPDTIVEVINEPVRTITTTRATTHSTTMPRTTTTTKTTTTTRTTTTSFQNYIDIGCNCHNHADQCTCSGKCYNCQHNTYGDQCQYCLPGYYGDATRGTPFDCSLYPVTTPSTTTYRPTTTTIIYVRPIERHDCYCNGHSYECTCSGYCLNCQHNTEGKYCNQCKEGYEGDPLSPRGCQKRIGFLNDKVIQTWASCNPHGTAHESDGKCICRSNVIGKYCDQCVAQSFNLITDHEYKQGCLSCFCNGLEVECHSSNLVYEKNKADFASEIHDWSIGDKFTKNVQELVFANNGLEYSDFNIFQDQEAFFIVPDKYKGNKISSYGGNLTIKLKYSSLSQESQKFELRISGSHVNIVYLSKENLIPDIQNEITVPLYEDEFKRYGDNGKVNREHMLMALSDIKLIMIRANYSPEQYLINLSEFGLDEAQEFSLDESESRQAKSVEVCDCPIGYSGNSCEHCAPGFKRSISGFYFGLCEPEF